MASKKYQDIKLTELESIKNDMSIGEFKKQKETITEKSCLCVGLANSAYMENDIEIKGQQQGIVICPGPNLAYFDKVVSLTEMVQHIYGNANLISDKNRPNMFVKELKMYVDYLKNELANCSETITSAQIKKWQTFKNNVSVGIEYYENLFLNSTYFIETQAIILEQLNYYKSELNRVEIP